MIIAKQQAEAMVNSALHEMSSMSTDISAQSMVYSALQDITTQLIVEAALASIST